jgi:hypothetical protein
MLANFYKLVNSTNAAHSYPVTEYNVPGKLGTIAERAIISNDTVMADMGISQEPATIADHSFPAVRSAAVYGYKFPDGAIVPNFNGGFFAVKFPVLGYSANNGAGENAAIFTNPGTFHDGYVAANPGSFTYPHIPVNDGKRINFYIIGKVRIGVYIRQWMYHKLFRAFDRARTVKHRFVWKNTIIAGSCWWQK